MIAIYEKIRELCEAQGISIAELERRAGFGNGTIGKWKDGNIKPNMESICKIADALQVTIPVLLEGNHT